MYTFHYKMISRWSLIVAILQLIAQTPLTEACVATGRAVLIPTTYPTHQICWHYDGELQSDPMTLYEVKSSPRKGLGVFATTHISQGTPILIEWPLFHVPMPEMVPGRGYALTEMTTSIQAAFDQLSSLKQQEFLHLHDHRFPSEELETSLLTIFRSNAYNTGDNRVGIFPKIARINHSCRPNAGNHWSEEREERVIYALKDIAEGEEILVSYIPLLKRTKERQERLQQYGFECDCDACKSAGEGDKRRLKAQDIFTYLPQKLSPPIKNSTEKTRVRLVAKAKLLLELLTEEGLVEYLPRAFHLSAMIHERFHNLGAAIESAKSELELLQWAEADSSAVREIIRLIEGWTEQIRSRNGDDFYSP